MAVCAEIGTPVPYDRDAALVLGPAAPGLYGPLRDPTDAEGWRRGFDWWRGQCLADARRLAVPRRRWLAIATQAGATFDEDFPGWAALIGPDGDVVAESADHREALLAVEVPLPDA